VFNLREQHSVSAVSTTAEAVGKFQAAPPTQSSMATLWDIDSINSNLAEKSTLGMA
jgi:hypothetical protein